MPNEEYKKYVDGVLERTAQVAMGTRGEYIWSGLLHYELADHIRDISYTAYTLGIPLDDGHLLVAVAAWKQRNPGKRAYIWED
jgi:hypothetical protein